MLNAFWGTEWGIIVFAFLAIVSWEVGKNAPYLISYLVRLSSKRKPKPSPGKREAKA